MGDTTIFRWLLNVENNWPAPNNKDPKSQSTASWATSPQVKDALRLLPASEQAKVLRFYRPHDAKLCLGSNLLKHKAIVDTCNVSWEDSTIGEDGNRKPCYEPPCPTDPTMEFNVSHHGTLVALVGCASEKTKLGVDIVQINWEKDYPMVVIDGFSGPTFTRWSSPIRRSSTSSITLRLDLRLQRRTFGSSSAIFTPIGA